MQAGCADRGTAGSQDAGPPTVALENGLGLAEVQARLHLGAHLQEAGHRVLSFYLCDMDERRLYQASGHSSTVHYAEEVLQLPRRRALELLTVGRKLRTLPVIDRALCDRRIGWASVLLLSRVATPEHEAAWLAHAERLSCRDLAREVKLARPGSAPRAPGERKGLPEVRFKVSVDVGVLTHRKFELAKEKLSAERGQPVGDAECLDMLAELCLDLEEDGTVPGRTRVNASLYRIVLHEQDMHGEPDVLWADTPMGPLPVADGPGSEPDDGVDPAALLSDCIRCDGEHDTTDAARVGAGPATADSAREQVPEPPPTPGWLRRRVLGRDGGQCRSCSSRHRLMVHHIRYRAEQGPTRASNLLTVCVACHALIHAGLLVLQGTEADTVRFSTAAGLDRAQLQERGRRLAAGLGHVALVPSVLVEAPEVDACEASVPTPVDEGGIVTLDHVPADVDGVWWRRHAHLLACRGDRGIEFRPGVPLDEAAVASAVPEGVAGEDLPFSNVHGQDALIERLRATVEGRRLRNMAFPHTLFVGPSGTGKTTFARGVAAEAGARLVETAGPFLQDVHALLRVLAELGPNDMLFVDEIHAVPRAVLEAVYQALAERRLSLLLHAGARARPVSLRLPPFALLAATTEEGRLPQALHGRFGLREQLAAYDVDALASIVTGFGRAHGREVTASAATRIGERSRGTPREALRLLDRVLDEAARAQVPEGPSRAIDRAAVDDVLAGLGYDDEGLDPAERRYLAALRSSPRPMCLRRLARILGESPRTLVERLEPTLVRRGLVTISTRGRELNRRTFADAIPAAGRGPP